MDWEKRATPYARHGIKSERHPGPDVGLRVKNFFEGDAAVTNYQLRTFHVQTEGPSKNTTFLPDVKGGVSDPAAGEQLAHDREFKEGSLVVEGAVPRGAVGGVW